MFMLKADLKFTVFYYHISQYVKIQYWDQKCDSVEFWNCFNYNIQCVILSVKDSYVQKIIVKDSSVNDFDLLTQAFVYYVSNIGHQNHWKKNRFKEKQICWITCKRKFTMNKWHFNRN